MIAFGTAVTDTETYERYAVPGLNRVAEPDSVILAHQTAGSVFHNYNLLLDKAAELNRVEALVLLHQDVELIDDDFCSIARDALSDPDVAIVGCAGSVGVRSIAWWQGAVTWAGLTHRYPENGGGDFPAISWRPEAIPSYITTGEVDSIDGFVMVLSPWAIRELRFDESLGKLHGYDFDTCMQAKAADKKVVTAPFRAIHHHSLELIKDPENWIQTYITLAEKWAHLLPDTGSDPSRRALRAEAEAACARALMVSYQMREQAVKRELARVSEELTETRDLLEGTRIEVEALTRRPSTDASAQRSQSPAAGKVPPSMSAPPGKSRAIEYAVAELQIESFASLEAGQDSGQYAFFAIDKPTIKRGVLVDVGIWRPRDRLLTTIEQAAEHPGMRVVDRDFADRDTVAEIGSVDAVLLFDVLHRMVDPDWDDVLELYAPATSHFVIANPQWEGSEETLRLLDLGREGFLEAVPPWKSHLELFDRLEEPRPDEQGPYRDAAHVWQWGITDADLVRKLETLGFASTRSWNLGPMRETEGFVNRAFVFSRRGDGAGSGNDVGQP